MGIKGILVVYMMIQGHQGKAPCYTCHVNNLFLETIP